MTKLIDITHTVKASAAPSEGARYMFDPATNERYWVEEIPEMAVPVEEPPPPPPEPAPEVPRKSKKLHHG